MSEVDWFSGWAGQRSHERHETEPFDGEPIEIDCRRGAACVVDIFGKGTPPITIQVFAMEAIVEIEVSAEPIPGTPVMRRAIYRDGASVSATLGSIADDALTLDVSCSTKPADRAKAAAVQARLLARTQTDERDTVRTLATLALADGRCVAMPEDAAITEAVLALDLSDPVLWWWPSGLTSAVAQVEVARGWQVLEAAVEHAPDTDAGAWMLFRIHGRARDLGDSARAESALARLDSPTFASTRTGRTMKWLAERRDRFVVAVGDPMPSMRFVVHGNDAELDTSTQRDQPTLYYVTSLACGSCKRNLPSLRAFAAARPEVQVVVIVMDEDPGAPARLVRTLAPIPGRVVRPEGDARDVLSSEIMTTMVYPSFVLTDADGQVAAVSAETSLDDLANAVAKPR